jgi:hypothetical protein
MSPAIPITLRGSSLSNAKKLGIALQLPSLLDLQ